MTKNDQQQITSTNYVRLREQIYESLIDVRTPEYRQPGVENLFAEGMPCDQYYAAMSNAYARLRKRLGVEDEDADVETIIDCLSAIEKTIAMKMYDYGFLMKVAQQQRKDAAR